MTKQDLAKQNWINDDLTYIWHPFTQMKQYEGEDKPICIVRGEGIYIEDIDGNRYMDSVSSWWVNSLGHANPRLAKALYEQACTIEQVIFAGFTHKPAISLAKTLVSMVNNNLTHVFYSDNGSTAIEVALKMAYQYWQLKGQTGKKKFIAFENAYHGDTLGAVSVGGIDMYHKVYRPLLFDILREKSPYCYRCPCGKEKAGCQCECLQGVEETLKKQHEEIVGIIIEPLIQAAGGMIMYKAEFLTKLRELCDTYNVLLIDDEVAMGFYRTGKLYAYEHAHIVPDIVCSAKALTAGFLPLAVTLCTDELYYAFYDDDKDGMKTFYHGHSFTANPLACAVANENLKILQEMDIENYLKPKIAAFKKGLERFADYPYVGDIRQWGMVSAVELVRDKRTKESFPYEEQIGKKIYLAGLKRGALLRPMWNCMYFMPPYVITEEEIEKLLQIAYDSMREVLG